MDYEKAYKAVLQTATQWIKDGCTDKEKICLECVFPELRESEDERIRKKLYNTVMGTPNDSTWFDGTSKEAMLAWLEKQEGKADSFTDDGERIRKWLIEYFSSIKDTVWIHRNTITCEQILAWLEKRKERKPVEWKPSEEQMLKEAVEGYVVKDITGSLAVTAKGINLDGFKFGDKVRIIIVKED